MEHRISATELARRVGDVLGRIRYRGDTFLIERNGEAVARIGPAPGQSPAFVAELLQAWTAAGPRDPTFAEDLERVAAADRSPDSPWDS